MLVMTAAVLTGNPSLGDSAPPPRLGQPISQAELERWDTDVFVDGRGLPAGTGNPQQGASLYESQCAACHGVQGVGATADHLTGDFVPLDAEWPDKHVGTYWPYATTLFDFIRRAMPMSAPGSLSADDIYAITAYILHINHIIGAHEEMNAETLPKVIMPNRNGFFSADPQYQRGAER
ncbi:MAG: cytochrome c [Gammaproteobacteria bacterium]|nr:cytochrome c [Gammaproteobacteria bacterium]